MTDEGLWGFRVEQKWLGGGQVGVELGLVGTGAEFQWLAPAGLTGVPEAGHSSQRQVAQCKQLILVVSCCNSCLVMRKGGEEVDEVEGKEGNRGHWGWSKGLEQGAMVPTLTSIFIHHRFPGRELHREQAGGRRCSSHQHFWSQTLLTHSVPEALGKSALMLLRARVLKMKSVKIHLPVTMDLQ